MKNKYQKLLLAAVVLLVVNMATVAMLVIRANMPSENPGRIDSPTSDSVVVEPDDVQVSASDPEPSASDVSDTPQIPEVVMTSLEGTDLALTIDRIGQDFNCNGMSVAVIENGQVAYNYEYGYANKSKSREVNSGTKFRIASLSKVFTSMLAMTLVDDGLLDLDTDISDIVGYQVRNPHSRDGAITMRMLLTHTSSMKDKSPIFTYSLETDLLNNDSYAYCKPGELHNYTNLGMGVAGALIEKISGKVLSDYSDEAFFDGMDIDAAFNGALLEDKVNVAECMLGTNVERTEAEMVENRADKEPGENHTVAAGGLTISAVDYAKLMTVLMNDGMYKGERYISHESMEVFHTTHFECIDFEQCIGIRRSSKVLEGRTVYYHTGAAYGVYTFALYDVSDMSGIVVFSTGAYDKFDEMKIRRICIDTAEAVYAEMFSDGAVSGSDAK